MLLNIDDPKQLFTADDLVMLNHAYWGHAISEARWKAASSAMRSLLSAFDTTRAGPYSDAERRYHRQLILKGFFAVFPYEFQDRLYDHISDVDPGPLPKKPSERIHAIR
jgi:hypothetical protein